MSRPVPLPPPGFDDLSVDEKLEYVQSLSDRIAADEREVPVPEWHKEILRQRLKDSEAHPEDVLDWEEVREDLQHELRKQVHD